MGIDIGGGGFSGIQVPGIHYAPNPLDEQQKYIDALTQWKQSEMARQTAADQQTHANATAWDNTQYSRGQDALAQQTAASNHQDALAQQQAQLAQQATLHQDTLDQRDQEHKDREQDRDLERQRLQNDFDTKMAALKDKHDADLKAKQDDAIKKHSAEIEKIIGTKTESRIKAVNSADVARPDLEPGIADYVRSRTDPKTGAWLPPPPPPDLVGGTVSAVEGGNHEGGNPEEAPQVAPNGVQPIPPVPVDIDQEIAQTRAKKAQDKATRQMNLDAEHDRHQQFEEQKQKNDQAGRNQHLKDLSQAAADKKAEKQVPTENYKRLIDEQLEQTPPDQAKALAEYHLIKLQQMTPSADIAQPYLMKADGKTADESKPNPNYNPIVAKEVMLHDALEKQQAAQADIMHPYTAQPGLKVFLNQARQTHADKNLDKVDTRQITKRLRDIAAGKYTQKDAGTALDAASKADTNTGASYEEEANAIAAQAAKENAANNGPMMAQSDSGPDGYNEKALAMQAGKSGLGQPVKGGDLTVNPQRTKATAAEAGAKPAETKDTSTPPATLPQLPKGQKWVRRADNKGWTAVKE